MVEYIRRAFRMIQRSPNMIAVRREKIIAFITIFAIVGSAFRFAEFSDAKSYTFTQNSWTGGVTANIAQHNAGSDTPVSGWNQYSSATSITAGATLQLGKNTATSTFTTLAQFNNNVASTGISVVVDTEPSGVTNNGLLRLESAVDNPRNVTLGQANEGSTVVNDVVKLAIDPSQNPHVISRYNGGGANTGILTYYQRSETSILSWPGNFVLASGEIWSHAFAIDANHGLHVFYADGVGIKYRYCNLVSSAGGCGVATSTADWSAPLSVVPFTGGGVHQMDAIVYNGRVYVLYGDDGYVKGAACTFTSSACGVSQWSILLNNQRLDAASPNVLTIDLAVNPNTSYVEALISDTGDMFRIVRVTGTAFVSGVIPASIGSTAFTTANNSSAGYVINNTYRYISAFIQNSVYVARCSVTATSCSGVAALQISPGAVNNVEGRYNTLTLGSDGILTVYYSHTYNTSAAPVYRRTCNTANNCTLSNSWTNPPNSSPYLTANADDGIQAKLTTYDEPHFAYKSTANSAAIYALDYVSSGTYESAAVELQTGSAFFMKSVSVLHSLPTGTSAVLRVKSGSTSTITGVSSCPGISLNGNTGPITLTPATNSCITDGHKYLKYHLTLGGPSTATPIIRDLAFNYEYYPSSGTLESSVYDTSDPTSVLAATGLQWKQTLSAGSKVKFQVRSAFTSNMTGLSYLGPDGTSATYFESTHTSCTTSGTGTVTVTCTLPSVFRSGTNDQFFQYKVILEPGSTLTSPSVSEVSVTYVKNVRPTISGVSVSGPDGAGVMNVGYTVADSDTASQTIYLAAYYGVKLNANAGVGSTNLSIPSASVNLMPASGTIMIRNELITYSGISTGGLLQNVSRGALNSIQEGLLVNDEIFVRAVSATGSVGAGIGVGSGKSITWSPAADLPAVHIVSGKIRVVANDGEPANQVGYGEATSIVIDTTPPTWSTDPAISLSANTISKGVASYKTKTRTHSMTYSVADPSGPTVAYAYGAGGTKGAGFDATSGLVTGTAFSASPSSPASVTLPVTGAVYEIYTFVKDQYGNTSNKSISVLYDPDAPAAPQSLQAIEVSNAGEIEFYLNWGSLSPAPEDASGTGDFKEYRIYRCTGGAAICSSDPGDSDFQLVGTTGALDANSTSNKISCSNCIGSEYFYKVTAVDDIGNESVPSNVIAVTVTGTTVDVSAPTIQGTPSVGAAGVNYIPITWTASETAYSQVAYDGIGTTDFSTSPSITNNTSVAASAQHTVNMVGLSPSQQYAYEVRAIDGSNNIGKLAAPTQTFTFPSIDTAQPTISAQISPVVYAKTAQFDISASEPVTALITYEGKKYGSYQYATTHSLVLPAVLTPGGQATYTVALRDLQGNETTSCSGCTGTLSLGAADTTRPQFASSTPIAANPDVFGATITWVTDEKTSGFVEIATALDANGDPLFTRTFGTRALSTSHTVTVTGLAPGTLHYFRVRSSDGAGNERISSQLNFTTDVDSGADTAPPSISGVTFDANKGSVLVRWTTSEPATAHVAVSTAQGFTVVSTTTDARLRTSHAVELPGLADATFYYMRIEATDAAGNTTIDDNGGVFYKFGTLKNTNSDIVISSVNVTVNESQTTVTWSTNEDTYGYVEYGFDRSFGEAFGNDAMARNHSVVLPPDILGKVTYTFRVRVRNSQGDEAVSENVAIFVAPSTKGTDLADDVTPPVISSVATPIITANSAVITWNTNELALTQLDYGVNDSYGYATTTTFNTTHSIVLTELTPKTTYVFKISATDEAGNIGIKDKDGSGQLLSFTTTENAAGETDKQIDPSDKAAPIISNVQVYDVKSRSAKIKWDTNEDSASLAEYGTVSGSRGSTAGSASVYAQSHDVEITGLKTGTKYYVAAIGLDYQGNRSISEELDFTTLASTTEEEALDELEQQLLDEASKQQLELLDSFNQLSSSTQALLQDFLAGIKTVDEEERAKALKVLFGELAGPPRILGSKPNVTVTDTTAIIEWETLTETNSIVAYASESEFEDDKNNPYTKEAGKKSEYVTIHKVTLTELKPFTTYNFQISGEEKGGTKTIGINRTFKTLPIQPKFEEFKIGDISEYSVKVSWKTNIPTKGVINVQDRATGEGRTIEVNEVKLDHEYVVKDLKSETRYALFVVAQSEEGETVRTDPRNFQTSPDSVPPEITSVRTKLTLSTGREDNVQAVITWSTDESSTSQVEYIEGARLEGSNIQKSPSLNDLTSSHVVVITRLRPATIYTFRVVSTDAAANRGESRQFKIFTPRKEESVLELIIKNFEDAFGFLKELQ